MCVEQTRWRRSGDGEGKRQEAARDKMPRGEADVNSADGAETGTEKSSRSGVGRGLAARWAKCNRPSE